MSKHEEVIRIIEERKYLNGSEEIIRELTEEMNQDDIDYSSIIRAADFIVDNPATDNTALGRVKRMSNIFSQDELNEKIGLIIDVVFANGIMPA